MKLRLAAVAIALFLGVPSLWTKWNLFDDSTHIEWCTDIAHGKLDRSVEHITHRFRPVHWFLLTPIYTLFGVTPHTSHAVWVLLHALLIGFLYGILERAGGSPFQVFSGCLIFMLAGPSMENLYLLAANSLDALFFQVVAFWGVTSGHRGKLLIGCLAGVLACFTLETSVVLGVPAFLGLFLQRHRRKEWAALLLAIGIASLGGWMLARHFGFDAKASPAAAFRLDPSLVIRNMGFYTQKYFQSFNVLWIPAVFLFLRRWRNGQEISWPLLMLGYALAGALVHLPFPWPEQRYFSMSVLGFSVFIALSLPTSWPPWRTPLRFGLAVLFVILLLWDGFVSWHGAFQFHVLTTRYHARIIDCLTKLPDHTSVGFSPDGFTEDVAFFVNRKRPDIRFSDPYQRADFALRRLLLSDRFPQEIPSQHLLAPPLEKTLLKRSLGILTYRRLVSLRSREYWFLEPRPSR